MVSKIETDQTAIAPDISYLTIEDDTPLNNLQSEKQQRLLTNSLYDSWVALDGSHRFLVAANVGVFYALK